MTGVNDPAVIHEDGTECRHRGPPARLVTDEGGAACAAGVTVTHVRFNGRDVPMGDAVTSLSQVAAWIANAFSPAVADLATAMRAFADGPQIRMIAEVAAAVEAERERSQTGT